MNASRFRQRVWYPAVEASVGRPCRFHDLRHSHAAMLIRQNAHPKAIQVRLGHASITTTLDTYGHLYEGIDEALADGLDASWRAAQEHLREDDVDFLWTPPAAHGSGSENEKSLHAL